MDPVTSWAVGHTDIHSPLNSK